MSYCSLDPIPPHIFVSCIDVIAPAILEIVNKSLTTGIFPTPCKQAIIKPLLKSSSLDKSVLTNYRPVANLSLLSKIIERAAMKQVTDYLEYHNLVNKFQSSYRANHSTETALLRVYNDILCNLDQGNDVVLILLDYSAAFDTIDHSILMRRLKITFGLSGIVLEWFKSYFFNRQEQCDILGAKSTTHTSIYGVPQGSVTGPLAYILYSSPIENIITSHNLRSMIYADDTQLYIEISKDSVNPRINNLEACLTDIKLWSNKNGLKLNQAKTEIIHFTSKFKRRKLEIPVIKFGSINIPYSQHARDLGVVFDSHLLMTKHINKITSSAHYGLRKVCSIRSYLSKRSTLSLVHAFVSSKLDYCNSLLVNLPSSQIKKLQIIQNAAARLIFGIKKRESITPKLRELHWLPIVQRVQFKILVLTYKALRLNKPAYLRDLLTLRNSARSLRSTHSSSLVEPRSFTRYGDRSFSICSPRLWNNLPSDIRDSGSLTTFKSKVKTHLFSNVYRN